MTKCSNFSIARYLLAWGVHLFTASGAVLGVYSLLAIFRHQYILAFLCMGLTVVIDAVDGTFARLVKVKEVLPNIDGALLDNIVDFLNYVVVPCFFLFIKPNMLLEPYTLWVIGAVTLTSCYQFCQVDAKTPDNFFKGFPCYWNFAIFYMFIFDTQPLTNCCILLIFCVLVFIPIKYVYPSRLDHLTRSKQLKLLMHSFSILYAISSIIILWTYPNNHPIWLGLSLGYVFLYLILSMYRTYVPLLLKNN